MAPALPHEDANIRSLQSDSEGHMTFANFISVDGKSVDADWAALHKHLRGVSGGQTNSLSMGLREAGADTFFIASFVQPSGVYVSAREPGDLDEFQLFDPGKTDELISCLVGGRTGSIIGRASLARTMTAPLSEADTTGGVTGWR